MVLTKSRSNLGINRCIATLCVFIKWLTCGKQRGEAYVLFQPPEYRSGECVECSVTQQDVPNVLHAQYTSHVRLKQNLQCTRKCTSEMVEADIPRGHIIMETGRPVFALKYHLYVQHLIRELQLPIWNLRSDSAGNKTQYTERMLFH